MEEARKAAMPAAVASGGDPRFNISQVEPSKTIPTAAATAIYTDEDAALDRELERLANENAPPLPIETDTQPAMTKEKEQREMLCDHLDVKPASTINELIDQVHTAKQYGCDSIYATEAIIRHYNRNHYPSDVGYFIFHNIKVYIEGHFEQASKRDKQTIQEKVFGLPKNG